MIWPRRKTMLAVDKGDPRTLLVVDRLEAVADRIDQLATEMEQRLKMGEGENGVR